MPARLPAVRRTHEARARMPPRSKAQALDVARECVNVAERRCIGRQAGAARVRARQSQAVPPLRRRGAGPDAGPSGEHPCAARWDGRAGERYIWTVVGRGYCFVAPITRSIRPGPVTADLPAAKSLTNLPAPVVRLIGRGEVVGRVSAQLARQRLITLIGPGGVRLRDGFRKSVNP
jgi:hypothetical protein